MRTTSASKNSWTTRRKPSSSGRIVFPPLQSVTASITSKGRPRRHFAECRTSGGRRRPTKSKPTLSQRTQKMFFSAIQEVYGPTKPRTTPLLSADGSTLLKEKSSINVRWKEHFSTLLNRPSTVDPTVLDQIPQKPVITSLDLPPTIDEASKAIKQTSSGKSPGMDETPAEIFKSTGPVALEAIDSLLTRIWENEDVPKEFKNATAIPLFKNRASKTDCSNQAML